MPCFQKEKSQSKFDKCWEDYDLDNKYFKIANFDPLV